ncbi:hypothetical protein D3C73_775690 [compost metagenome]
MKALASVLENDGDVVNDASWLYDAFFQSWKIGGYGFHSRSRLSQSLCSMIQLLFKEVTPFNHTNDCTCLTIQHNSTQLLDDILFRVINEVLFIFSDIAHRVIQGFVDGRVDLIAAAQQLCLNGLESFIIGCLVFCRIKIRFLLL